MTEEAAVEVSFPALAGIQFFINSSATGSKLLSFSCV